MARTTTAGCKYSTVELSPGGDAVIDGETLVLTTATNYEYGFASATLTSIALVLRLSYYCGDGSGADGIGISFGDANDGTNYWGFRSGLTVKLCEYCDNGWLMLDWNNHIVHGPVGTADKYCDGTWHNISVALEATSVNVWLDGVRVFDDAIIADLSTRGEFFRISAWTGSRNNNHWVRDVDVLACESDTFSPTASPAPTASVAPTKAPTRCEQSSEWDRHELVAPVELIGDAELDGGVVRLTRTEDYQSGTAVFELPVAADGLVESLSLVFLYYCGGLDDGGDGTGVSLGDPEETGIWGSTTGLLVKLCEYGSCAGVSISWENAEILAPVGSSDLFCDATWHERASNSVADDGADHRGTIGGADNSGTTDNGTNNDDDVANDGGAHDGTDAIPYHDFEASGLDDVKPDDRRNDDVNQNNDGHPDDKLSYNSRTNDDRADNCLPVDVFSDDDDKDTGSFNLHAKHVPFDAASSTAWTCADPTGANDAYSCGAHTELCLPSWDLLGRGYNVLKDEVVGRAYALSRGGGTRPIDGKEYAVPPEVDVFETSTTSSKAGVYSNMVDYLRGRSVLDGVDGALGGLLLESSATTNAVAQAMERGLLAYDILRYQVHLRYAVHSAACSNHLVARLEILPTSIDGNFEAFEDLFETYGTHVVVGALLGGSLGYDENIPCDDDDDDPADALLKRVDAFDYASGYSSSEEAAYVIDRNDIAVAGGDSGIFRRSGWDAWVDTISTGRTAVLSYSLVPMWRLVANSRRREAIYEATRRYVTNSADARVQFLCATASTCATLEIAKSENPESASSSSAASSKNAKGSSSSSDTTALVALYFLVAIVALILFAMLGVYCRQNFSRHDAPHWHPRSDATVSFACVLEDEPTNAKMPSKGPQTEEDDGICVAIAL
ncbi:hypothetical protein CTAYLR_001560 [Chrysophaeum taylorii]|uniref:MACPF domain-containing protein n=1 Tax=Chrysophaeum taylorii TaxID=2483200 RepID=A0AAD7UD88_9STRA|nr:hypothetical protein CTAYLR_001560 [Chrysophaeum taylorii]